MDGKRFSCGVDTISFRGRTDGGSSMGTLGMEIFHASFTINPYLLRVIVIDEN